MPTVRKATRRQTRIHNTRLVLRTIYDAVEISRADIARETGLTRPTVSNAVSDLLDERLIEEVGYGPSTGGKPPMLLSVADGSRHLVGIDLASGAFRGALVSLQGEIYHRVSRSLDGQEGEAALELAYDVIDELVALAEVPLVGIGIGTPGLMDTVNGVVRWAVNLGWKDLPLRRLLQDRYELPVYVANDCHAAALAEHTFGDHSDVDNLVVIKVEHGVGSGILINGRLFFGDTFGAGEIGHLSVVEGGEMCRCGHRGCLETVASARALVERARRMAWDEPESLLSELVNRPEAITIETVCEALDADDPTAVELVQEVGRYLGIAAANVVSVLSTRRILIAGTVTCFGDALRDAIQQEMLQRSLAMVAEGTEIALSSMGPDIVILGASALVLNYELGLLTPLPAVTSYAAG